MSEPYPYELRVGVVMMDISGSAMEKAAKRFDVPYSTADHWRHEYVMEGRLEAKPQGGDRRSHHSEQHAERIIGWVEAQCDLTITEICERLAEQE